MSKIIIQNDSGIDDAEALRLTAIIVSGGRISDNGKQYCFLTVFEHENICIRSFLNKNSDRFVIWNSK